MSYLMVRWQIPISAATLVSLFPSLSNAAEGVGMPQFDVSTFPTQLIWLVITFAILFCAMHYVALPRITDSIKARRHKVASDLDQAQTIKEEAEVTLENYENILASGLNKANDFNLKIAQKLTEQAVQARSELALKLAKETELAEQRIAAEMERSLGEIREVAVELVKRSTTVLAGLEVGDQEVTTTIEAITPEFRQ